MPDAIAFRAGRTLLVLSLAPLLFGFTSYDSLAAWQAAVGPSEVEDFESFAEMRLPEDGGSSDFIRFAVENDDQGDNEWTGDSGLYRGSHWYAYPELPDTMNLIISTEPDEPGIGGPYIIDAVFPQPIIAYGLEYSWCEDDEECAFDGFLLDEPVTRFSLWEPGYCEHSWCAIDAIHWVNAPIPEPGTGALIASALAGLALRRRALRRS